MRLTIRNLNTYCKYFLHILAVFWLSVERTSSAHFRRLKNILNDGRHNLTIDNIERYIPFLIEINFGPVFYKSTIMGFYLIFFLSFFNKVLKQSLERIYI
uniref:Uncharacterized protein n=1 Tax=Cacopsylla melanoneura TaxID=428564 RepID=A0A8D8VC55_9HEMI